MKSILFYGSIILTLIGNTPLQGAVDALRWPAISSQLMRAVEQNDLPTFQNLVKTDGTGANPLNTDPTKEFAEFFSPYHYALMLNRYAMVKWLLETYPLIPDAWKKEGLTSPLPTAFWYFHENSAEQKGYDQVSSVQPQLANLCSAKLHHPLILAMEGTHTEIHLSDLAACLQGENETLAALESPDRMAAILRTRMLQLLVHHGAKLNTVGERKHFPNIGAITPLSCAVGKGFVGEGEYLLLTTDLSVTSRSFPEFPDDKGVMPLMRACIAHGASEKGAAFIELFIRAGANFNLTYKDADNNVWSPLTYLIAHRAWGAVELMVNNRNYRGKPLFKLTPVSLQKSAGAVEISTPGDLSPVELLEKVKETIDKEIAGFDDAIPTEAEKARQCREEKDLIERLKPLLSS